MLQQIWRSALYRSPHWVLQASEMRVIWKEQEMKFRKIASAAAAAAFAITGVGLGVAAANAAEGMVPPDGDITINGSTSVEHDLKGYLLATYSDIDVDGNTLNSFNLTTNPTYADQIVNALTDDQRTAYQNSQENGNPMAWVVSNLSAAQLRQFGINLQKSNLAGGTAFKLGTNTVPTGYYFITDQTTDDALQGKAETISQPMILSTTVNTATQDSKGNTLGTVNLKNSTTEIYKQVVKTDSTGAYVPNTQPDYGTGDLISYELTSKTPDFNGYNIDPTRQDEKNTRVFTIIDTMSKGISYTDIEYVKVGDTTLKAADYDITTAAVAENGTKYAGGTQVTIDLGEYVNKAAGSTLAGSTNEIPAGEPVTVLVKAMLNFKAAISTPSNIQANPNKVELEFSHNPSDNSKKTTIPGGEVNVYTFKLQLKKTDKSGSTPLPGAGFTIKLVAADNNPNVGRYVAGGDGYGIQYTDNEDKAATFTSNDQGIIDDLDKVGFDAGTYEVHETKAPAGYLNANFQAIKFQVKVAAAYEQDNSTKPESKTIWGDNNATGVVIEEGTGDSGNMVHKDGTVDYQFDVKNAKSFTQLPLTGATGMRMLTIAALIAASAGAILVVRARHMRADI